MKIIVDHQLCQGHARCAAIAPRVYHLDDNGYNRMPETAVPAALEVDAVRGAESCPEFAVTIES